MAETISPLNWLVYRRTFTAAEFKTLGTIPIDLLPAPGSGRGYIVDPYSIQFRTGSGTAFDFIEDITLNNGVTWFSLPFADINGATYGTAKPVVISVADIGVSTISNFALTLAGGGTDATVGTKTPTLVFTYAIIPIP